MSENRRRTLLAVAVLASAVAFSAFVLFRMRATPPPAVPVAISDPPLRSSPFANSQPDAKYVGESQCVSCHAEEHESWRHTTHSRAFGLASEVVEPVDRLVTHSRSGRNFRVQKENGPVHHQEILPADATGREIVLADFPLTYAVGSGHHARSFLVEIDGFLFESPLTWYADGGKWDMSPGYDRYDHSSFSRLVGVECLRCHTGKVDFKSPDSDRVQIHQQHINCENCHGPGSLHVARHTDSEHPKTGLDRTIVNPAHLSRQLSEDICAQCHASGISEATVRGRSVSDYRPGLALADFLVKYRLEDSEAPMTVTSHFEQLSRSLCYQKSETLTCTTCHPPHSPPAEGQQFGRYRAICQSCHTNDASCGIPESERRLQSPLDDCTSCHMGRQPTQVPHVAFTNHEILRHPLPDKPSPGPSEVAASPRLTPLSRLNEDLSPLDAERCLALATLSYSDALGQEAGDELRRQAFALLEKVSDAGIRDADVLAALARLHWSRKSKMFEPLALAVMDAPDSQPEARMNAMYLLATARLNRNDSATAADIVQQMVQRRPETSHWNLLGDCRRRSSDMQGALAAYQKAIEVLPLHPEVHLKLADLYETTGDSRAAGEHRRLAQRFIQVIQRLGSPEEKPRDTTRKTVGRRSP